MSERHWSDWGEVYNHYKAKGMDPSDAAYRADQWEKRLEAARRNETPHCATCTCAAPPTEVKP
jgi:hypothetical protein